MHQTKALAGAIDARQDLLGRFGGVPGFGRHLAVITVAALIGGVVGEVSQQHFTATAGDFAESQHGVEFVALGTLKLFRAIEP